MARKSKKVDYVNAGSMGQQTVAMPSVPKNICYKAGLYARLSEETQANIEAAAENCRLRLTYFAVHCTIIMRIGNSECLSKC